MKRKTRIIASLLVALMVLAEASVCVIALDGEAGTPPTNTTPPVTETNKTEAEPATSSTEGFENGTIPTEEEGVESPNEDEIAEPFSATATKLGPTSIKLEWTPIESTEPITYTVTEASGLVPEQVFDGSITFKTFEGLKTGKTYIFTVVARSGEFEETATTEAISLDPQPATVTGLYTYSSYKRIVLEWKKDKFATKYYIYRKTSRTGSYKYIGSATNEDLVKGSTTKVMFTDRKVTNDKYYYYRIVAIGTEGYRAEPSVTKYDRSVKQMYLRITFRYSKTLTSHDSAKRKHTFKKGQTIKAYGYGGGKYRFYYNGRPYRVMYARIRNPRAYYTKNFNYSVKEAEYYVNATGQSSSTRWLIWVNLYTQHCYVFKGSKGKWKLYSHWEIASGKATTPTPTGLSKTIFRKVANKNGLGPWSCFHSWSSFHGKRPSWKVGTPASGGCIRNTMEKGRWIYKNMPYKTRVMIY